MSTHTVPAIPAGFSADDWADDWADTHTRRPFRLIWGPQRKIGDNAVVRLSATQYVDGSIDETEDDGPAIHVDVLGDWGVNAKHARQLAAAILAEADEADRLVAK
jgi:hypothetical protein